MRERNGFTVVEILVALILASFTVAMLVSVHSSIVKSRQALEENREIERLLEAAESIEVVLQRSGEDATLNSIEIEEILSNIDDLESATILMSLATESDYYRIFELDLIATQTSGVYQKKWKVVVGDLGL